MATSKSQRDDPLLSNIQQELEGLKKDRVAIDEENAALTIRSESVLVLSDLLKRSQQEAKELRRQLAEQKDKDNQKQKNDNDSKFPPSASVSGTDHLVTGSQSACVLDSLATSPWNTLDTEKMQGVFMEMHTMQEKNTELASKLEATLKEQANANGTDKDMMDHLNGLRSAIEEYKNSVHGDSNLLSRLSDEADRLKAKLTSTAITRGVKLGKLQDEIDDIKAELKEQLDREERIAKSLTPMGDNGKQFSSEVNNRASQAPNNDPVSMELLLDFAKVEEPVNQLSIGNEFELVADETHQGTNEPGIVEKPASVKPKEGYQIDKDLKEANLKLLSTMADQEIQIDRLISEKTELIKINHSWDAQYRKLKEHLRNEMRKKDSSYQKLQKQLSEEHRNLTNKDLLDQKDSIIEEQAEKIRSLKEELFKLRADSMQYMQARYDTDVEKKYQRAKKLFQEQKKENEMILQREEAMLEEFQMLKATVEVFEKENTKLKVRNEKLEIEIARLAVLIESGSSERRSSSFPPSISQENGRGPRRQNSLMSSEQIELLKQQISIYVEDFNTEKEEKQKLALEIRKLKDKLRISEKEAEDAKRQMQVYEHDFRAEREEKLRFKQLYNTELYQDNREQPIQRLPQSPDYAELLRQHQEYIELENETKRIYKRMEMLKQKGADKLVLRRPDYLQDRIYSARGAGTSPTTPSPTFNPPEDNMFFGGDVVRDEPSSNLENQVMGARIVCRTCSNEFESSDSYYHHKNFCNRYCNSK